MPVVKMPDGQLVDMPDSPSPEQLSALQQVLSGGGGAPAAEKPSMLGEAGRVLGKSLYGGLTAIPRLVMEGGNWLEEKFPTPAGTKLPIPGYKQLAQADAAIQQAVEPRTQTGQMLGRVGEAAVGAVAGPGGVAAPFRSALIGAGSGAGAEAAGALTDGNVLARLGGDRKSVV